jgi:hypothetical protein
MIKTLLFQVGRRSVQLIAIAAIYAGCNGSPRERMNEASSAKIEQKLTCVCPEGWVPRGDGCCQACIDEDPPCHIALCYSPCPQWCGDVGDACGSQGLTCCAGSAFCCPGDDGPTCSETACAQ